MKIKNLLRLVLAFLLVISVFVPYSNSTIFAKTNTAYVNADVLNVRAKASTSSKKLGTLKYGTKVIVYVKNKSGWATIKYKGKKAYVKAEFLSSTKKKSFLMDRTMIYTVQYSGGERINFKFDHKNTYNGMNEYYWFSNDGAELSETQTATEYRVGGGFGGAIVMKRNAKVGDKIYSYGSAEKFYDGKIISVNAKVKTHARTFTNCTVIKENGGGKRYYAPGHGMVKKVDKNGKILTQLYLIKKRK
ncbi:SH3 domain-containing protein [Heyndrickxia vini]|uniref:SH3 domain-containing protein n=1 Tax=Heyndrickxia vini TaxID=1476025 RepID=A0ABX7E3Y4_9BACI|nr:SH3 domain-containing protein [Heyndrickxia vini]QQZ10010.1 SH3 domain-containing protein [Heyndrickxia vini]